MGKAILFEKILRESPDVNRLDFPEFRQVYDHDCGANAFQSVLVYYGHGEREEIVMKKLKTTENGTNFVDIIRVAEEYGITAIPKHGMTITDLKTAIDKGNPVMIALQAWVDDYKEGIDWASKWNDGHWVVVVGYERENILFEDPSAVNRTYIPYNELLARWHDLDGNPPNEKKVYQFGIEFVGIKNYSSQNIVHMEDERKILRQSQIYNTLMSSRKEIDNILGNLHTGTSDMDVNPPLMKFIKSAMEELIKNLKGKQQSLYFYGLAEATKNPNDIKLEVLQNTIKELKNLLDKYSDIDKTVKASVIVNIDRLEVEKKKLEK